MTIDLDDLDAKAKAATNMASIEDFDWYTEDSYSLAHPTIIREDRAFIAAANPSVILELIGRLRAAESALFRVAGYVRGASERVRRGIDGTAYPEVARPGWEPEGEASDDRS